MTAVNRTSKTPPVRQRVARWVRHVARAQQKKLGIATILLALVAISRLTLMPIGRDLPAHFRLCVPCGETGTADFILNVALFVPLGVGLRLAGVGRVTAWTVALLLTGSIEALQLYVVPGRDSDASDIVANAMGAAIGILLVDRRRMLLTPVPKTAGRLAAGTTLAYCCGTAILYWTLAPAVPPSVYYEQIAPDLPGYSVFDGTVLAASFDGAPLHIGRLSADSSAAMRGSLLASDAVIEATMVPGTTRPDIAPILAAHDQHRREVFLFARHVDDLMFRMRRRTDLLGFHTPSTILSQAFPTQSGAGDTLTTRVLIEPGATTLDVAHRDAGRGPATRVRLGQGIWDAWRLLIPDDGRWAAHVQALTILWIAGVFVPIGYWAGRCARRDGLATSIASPVIPLVASLAIIPWASGAPVAPWPVWGAGGVGAAVAWGFARWIDV